MCRTMISDAKLLNGLAMTTWMRRDHELVLRSSSEMEGKVISNRSNHSLSHDAAIVGDPDMMMIPRKRTY